jgi:1,4-dihydroxy-2-naphthoyl-CoA synthase
METVTFERDEARPGLAIITLNRPDKLNAINPQMHEDLQEACRRLQDDPDTRVVIVTGAGRAPPAPSSAAAAAAPQRPTSTAASASATPTAPAPRSRSWTR